MKKFTFLLGVLMLILLPFLAFAEPITAESVAVPATNPWSWVGVYQSIVRPALEMGLMSLLAWATTKGVKLLNTTLKHKFHGAAVAVVIDALTEVLAVMGAEVTKALADGKLTAEERTSIKDKARVLIKDRLGRLAGFYKGDLIKWIDEQMEIGLGKLSLRLGSKGT